MSNSKRLMRYVTVGLFLCLSITCALAGSLEKGFISPPASARPWVYWFWLNGNITREGITADLEAMKRVGIGGVLIMEVDQGAPVGPVDFMSDQWREMFKRVVSEAGRLGLEVNMNDDAGWNGSGGPWIKPEESMQKVVFSEIDVEGPCGFDGVLPQPETLAGYYRDISALAFPTTGAYRIPGIRGKAAYDIGAAGPTQDTIADEMIIDRNKIVDVSAQMDATGHLTWDVPPGKWTIARFGHTVTGAQNHPAPATGRGLECDKLSKEGSEAHFNGMMAKLITDSAPAVGKALVATHVDSWEIGSQNWTAKMREEFRRRRGYDMLPFLPVMTGRVIGSLEVSERFLWDLRRTISELVVENYAGHIRKLANQHGLRFTIEAYGSPCDSIPYGGQADEPMGEFWEPGGAIGTCKGMASAAHVYGKTVVGAEAFTAFGDERWLKHPAALKALGDEAFCEGINRFVFHRYALQPWTPERKPGMMMGPWGQHYERTQTWWELTSDWHRYLARCQFMLRQGLFVADICYLQAELPPGGLGDHPRLGYGWDECGAEVVLKRMSVRNGRIVLPDGMSYRVLALSNTNTMTPQLLRKISDLVRSGATVIGSRPLKSPSMTDYPKCDIEVKLLADELWADCDGKRVKERRFGKGRVVCGITPEKLLAQSGIGPDFAAERNLRWIHRVVGDTDIYFVSNPQPYWCNTVATFRITGKVPELWWPDTGRMERAAVYRRDGGTTSVLLPFEPNGSVFVVFRKKSDMLDPVIALKRNGNTVLSAKPLPQGKIVVQKAVYGVLDDPKRTRDVRDKVQRLVDAGERSFVVARLAEGDDPAVNIVKTAIIDYTVGGKPATVTGIDTQAITLDGPSAKRRPIAELHYDPKGKLRLLANDPGVYEVINASGKRRRVTVGPSPRVDIKGPWRLRFPPKLGAPVSVTLDKLISWTEHSDDGVKYFSGTAVYHTTFNVTKGALAKSRVARLDLGDAQVFAQVKLNGRDLGVLWKPPYSITLPPTALRPGRNDLEVKVTNLWPNRMIGDELLPEDSERNPDGTLKSWPQWLLAGKPSPTGRHTFATWRLWKKDDQLLKSGLLGPVKVEFVEEIRMR